MAVFGQEVHVVDSGDGNCRAPWAGPSAPSDTPPVVHTPLSVLCSPCLCTPSSHHAQSACTQPRFPLLTRVHTHAAHPRAHSPEPLLACITQATQVPTQALTHRTHATHRQARSCHSNGCRELGSVSGCWPPLPARICQAVSMATHLGSDRN